MPSRPGERRRHPAAGRGGVWTVAAAGMVVVVLTALLIRTSGEGGQPVSGPGGPNGVGVVTGTPADVRSLPPATASDSAPTPSVETPASGPPTAAVTPTAPVTPTARRAPAPAPAPPGPPRVTSYEAESSVNSLAGTRTFTCHGCSGDRKVGNIGAGMGALRFNGIGATEGPATVTLVYVNGERTRFAHLDVNGRRLGSIGFPGTGGWSTIGALSFTVRLHAGANTLRLSNSNSAAPDFDRIVVSVPAR